MSYPRIALAAILAWTAAPPGVPAADEAPKPDFSQVPGVVVDHSPASSGRYIGSPSIAVLPDGSCVASHDFFGPKSIEHELAVSAVFRSEDRGRTWRQVARIDGAFWSNLFVHQGHLYLLGPNRHHGLIVIRRSDDGGRTWTKPKDTQSGLLTPTGEYHTAPTPVLVHNGRLWRAVEDGGAGRQWGVRYRAMMFSAPVDADLLRADSWTRSNYLQRDPKWLDGKFLAWLEGNAVATPEGEIVDILRVNGGGPPGKAAVVHVSGDGRKATFDPATGFIDLPGAAKKFTIRYDPKSKAYWSLVNPVLRPTHRNPGSVRNTLALVRSEDLRKWEIRCILLYHPDVTHHAFQYPDWVFDGEDIVAAIRTAYDDGLGGAHNAHDANFLTFHRFARFRHLTMADSVVDPAEVGRPPLKEFETPALKIEGRGVSPTTLDNGATAFGNRNYVWEEVPSPWRGRRCLQTRGGEPAEVRVTARQAADVYLATAPSQKGIDLAGWQAVAGATFRYSDHGRTSMAVYRRSVNAGQTISVPQGNWTGGLVLLPPEQRPEYWGRTREGPSVMQDHFFVVDWVVLVAYFAGTMAIGFHFWRRSRSTEGFTAAGRSLPGWACGLSIFATYLSSISFLALPGKAFASNWNPFVFSLSLPLATWIAVRWFLPYYRRSEEVSAYAHLEHRFGPWARIYASVFYLLTQIARMGAVMYLMALPLSVLLGWDIRVLIVITGLSVTLYTFVGGIAAVIWADAMQAIVLMGGAVVCLGVMLAGMPEGPGQVFTIAAEQGKFSLGSFGPSLSDATFWVVLVYGLTINLQNFGIDQSYVQRYIASSSDREARKSVWLGGLLYVPVSAVFFMIGTALFAYYQARPADLDQLRTAVAVQQLASSGVAEDAPDYAEQVERSKADLTDANLGDKVFPQFIGAKLPAGVTGLLVAAVFAAAMSTVSTSLNSSATLIMRDYYQRYVNRQATERQSMAVLYGSTILWGALGTGVALLLVQIQSALDAWWTLSSIFSGGILGLFLLGLISRRAGNPAAATAVILGLAVILWMTVSVTVVWPQSLAPLRSPFHQFMVIVVGTLTILLTGLIVSRFAGRSDPGPATR